MSKKAKIENYAKALSAIDRARASLDELEAQILEDTEADLDFVKAFVALLSLKDERENILTALVESTILEAASEESDK
ncbi:hypothetical protein [Sutterella wadsworthensis]|jgi:hypothetical protein|uniref:hypothetical protein n=1 Tax=Sutterella wadsworthensis TaxID=40545 RepID=UPI00241CAF84|nr:hypothetical protein [Sutterella wadsworthensis]